jgi:uncharacterized protein (TIGR03437 family)
VLSVAPVAIPQSANTVFGSGYSLPLPVFAAPGGITNLFVQGVGNSLAGPVTASSLPLPDTLAGISVTIEGTVAGHALVAPILAVRPISTCVNPPTLGACGRYTAITVQIPFEFGPSLPTTVPNAGRLVVSENGVAGGPFEIWPGNDRVHVLTACDFPAGCGSGNPLVTHSDGTLVYVNSPAKPGEELVMYALGLGATNPSVATGQASPSPAAVTREQFQLSFDFAANTPPSDRLVVPPECATLPTCPLTQPRFSGLTPGFAGLYQVNFIVPTPPPGTPPCNNNTTPASNLTVSLIGETFDGACICVDTSGNLGSKIAVGSASIRHRVQNLP